MAEQVVQTGKGLSTLMAPGHKVHCLVNLVKEEEPTYEFLALYVLPHVTRSEPLL